MGFVTKTADPEQRINFAEWGITPSTYETPREDELRHMYHSSFKQAEEGSIVTGRVVAIQPQHVVVDVGLKSEGVIPREEFGPGEEPYVGQMIEVLLLQCENQDGTIQLSKVQADKQRAWERMMKACETDGRVKGKVTRKVKGGLIVSIGGIDAFLPSSQIALQNVKNVDEYLGQEIEVKVIKVNEERQNVVVSRRELLDEERMERKREFLENIKVGDIRQGVVKNITDFGAFIDLHGIDGLLHLTDMKWGRINHPSEMLQLGQTVDVMIIGIDYEKERVSLGIKQMYDNPWLDVETKYPVGSIVRGKVVNILPYGAFVELEEGVEGLIHISEFSWTRKVNHPSEFVKLGDEVAAVVLNVDPYDQKISLGLRQTQANPWDTVEQRYPVGSRVRGVVRNLTTYGAFVELEEGIDGLIHVSDMSWTRKINHPSEMLKKGEEVEAVVLNVNAAERKIALGLKQLTPDPWERIHELYKEGDIVTGKITNTTSFGAFIQLQHDIEGLIHISELADRQVGNVRDVVKVGDEVTGKIVRVDPAERKIAVSIRAYEREKAQEAQRAAQAAAAEKAESAPAPQERKRFESGIDISTVTENRGEEETREESKEGQEGKEDSARV